MRTTGTYQTSVFFAKMDALGERVATTSFQSKLVSNTYNMAVRRIILEKSKAFVSGNDNSALYFCGFASTNQWYVNGYRQGDMIFGKLSSKDLSAYASNAAMDADIANALKLEVMVMYGSPDQSEYFFGGYEYSPNEYGDCAMTEDNAYLVGVFSTVHSYNQTWRIIWDPSYTLTTANPAFDEPTAVTASTCANHHKLDPDLRTFFSQYNGPPWKKQLALDCESQMWSWSKTYVDEYTNSMYSWRQCYNSYTRDFSASTCSANRLVFSFCDTDTGNSDDSHVHHFSPSATPDLFTVCPGGAMCPANSCYNFRCGSESCNQQQLALCRANHPGGNSIGPGNPLYNPAVNWGYAPNWGACPPAYPDTCCQDCQTYLTYYNQQYWWYESESQCGIWEYRKNVYDLYIASYRNFDPVYFCTQTAAKCTANINSYVNQIFNTDKIYFIFEQDCGKDSWTKIYSSMYIYKVDLSKLTSPMVAANLNSMPEAAVYFGENNGNTYGQAIAVDTYGYIYVHGRSNSAVFGGNLANDRSSWLHVKTHWELTYEIQHNQNLGLYTEQSPGFLSKRFIRPKKFQNAHGITFLILLYDSSVSAALYTFYRERFTAFPVNERMYTMAGAGVETANNLNSFVLSPISDFSTTQKIWGYSYARMSPVQDIRMNISSTIYKHSFHIPSVCQTYETTFTLNAANAAIQKLKIRWMTKRYTFTNPYNYEFGNTLALSLTGLSYDQTTTENYITGTIAALTNHVEGAYYMMIRSSTHYYVHTPDKPVTYSCNLDNYGYFLNDMTKESLRRYEQSIRIKILVDKIADDPPMLLKTIDQVQAVVGQRYQFVVDPTIYFSGCTRTQARKALDSSGIVKTTQLPQWMKYYERNSTFTMYPSKVGEEVAIQLQCCNAIEQCAWASFKVTCINQAPVRNEKEYLAGQNQILLVDGTVGQEFKWQKRSTEFWDPDLASKASGSQYGADDTKYRKTDHQVYLDFTTVIPFFKKVASVGLFFGQSSMTNALPLGFFSATATYTDGYLTTPLGPYTPFTVTVVRRPMITAQGAAYKFDVFDPFEKHQTYFDEYFPMLKKQGVFTLEISEWFTNYTQVSYSVRISGAASTEVVPSWIQFNQLTGQLQVSPTTSTEAQLLNLVFTCTDVATVTSQVSLYKQILINTAPRAVRAWQQIEAYAGKKFTHDISSMFEEQNPGDWLQIDVASDRLAELDTFGISFNSVQQRIVGEPPMQGTISMMKITATDQHGAQASALISIKITDMRIGLRSGLAGGRYSDVSLREFRPFYFKLHDFLFYDSKEYRALILTPSDLTDKGDGLPSWLNFDPIENSFYGTAPEGGSEKYQVKMRATNPKSHDTLSTQFSIKIVKRQSKVYYPRFAQMLHDISLPLGTWFDVTFPLDLFGVIQHNTKPAPYSLLQGSAAPLPAFLSYNEENRTFHGFANVSGVWHLDFVFTDDLGNRVYSNVKVTVLPRVQTKFRYYLIVSVCAFSGSVIYLAYIMHWISLSSYFQNLPKGFDKGRLQNMRSRFGRFKDINVMFMQVINAEMMAQDNQLEQQKTDLNQTTVQIYNSEDPASSARNTETLHSEAQLMQQTARMTSTIKIRPPAQREETASPDFRPASQLQSQEDHYDATLRVKEKDVDMFEFNNNQ